MQNRLSVFLLSVLFLGCVGCVHDSVVVREKTSESSGMSSCALYTGRTAPSETRGLLRVKIVTATCENDFGFSSRVAQGISGGFTSPDVQVIENGTSDFLLNVAPRLTLFDKTGDNYIYEAGVTLSLKDAAGSRVYSSKQFHWKGDREFGQETALRKMVDKIVPEVTNWASEALRDVASQDFACSILSLQLPRDLWDSLSSDRKARKDSHHMQEIAEKIKKLNGVLQFEMTDFQSDSGMATFRVVYVRSDYPMGISNAISDCLNRS